MAFEYQFTYETTGENETVTSSTEVRVQFEFEPARDPVYYRGEQSPTDPPEPPSIEIVKVEIETVAGEWREATKEEFQQFSEYALDMRFDNMEDIARDSE